MGKRDERKVIYIIAISIFAILLLSVASAGVADWFRKITGRATGNIQMNISVGVPEITNVYNETFDLSSGPNQALSNTNLTINFTVYSPSGFGELNYSSAKANISSANEETRSNSTCERTSTFSTSYANLSCTVTLWWWDGAATWDIFTYIQDNNTNAGQNLSTTVVVGTRDGFEIGPGNLTWPAIGAGATNTTPTSFILLNNTGNNVIEAPDIEINATSLKGETTPAQALWGGNFSVSHITGSNVECALETSNATNASNYQKISPANLTKGNYTLNDYATGQEQLYFCLKLAGTELTTQAYSTFQEGAWTIQIS